MELWKLGATKAAAGIRDGEFKPSELMEAVLGRAEATDHELNAFTSLRGEAAMAEARAADEAVASGAELGPLHGIPVSIKVNIDVAGEANTNGVPAFAELMATEDAPLVARLKEAGAIVFGRTNTPEFSMRGTTDNPLHGRTFNPWGSDISPGGSSGGAGAACAAGIGPLHHGNDIGGSLRFPSFANGVMTIKPTSFRIPVYNSSATADRGPLATEISVQGIIARHAADVRLATQVMIEPDPRDPNSPPVPWAGPPAPKRVAVARATAGYEIHPGIAALIDRAAAQLADAGYEVVEVEPPDIAVAAQGWFSALTTEMKVTSHSAIKEHGSDTINRIFEWYFDLSELLDLDGFVQASGARTRLKREWSEFGAKYPLVLTPFLMRPMYDWDYDARSAEAVKDLFESAVYSTGINYLGLPAGVIGTGMVEERPAAVQIVGARWREDLIAEALAAIESANGVLTDQLWART